MALTPYQQRRRARILALPPEKQAILGFAADQDTEQASAEDAQKDLMLQRLGAAKDLTGQRMDMAEQDLATRGDLQRGSMALQRRALTDEIGQSKRAEMIGMGNIGLSGALGFGQILQDKERAKQFGALASLYQ
jgi:hypothetical protein